jgi:hypothetical protein
MIDQAWVKERIAEVENYRGQCLAELNASLGRLAELEAIGKLLEKQEAPDSNPVPHTLHLSAEPES